MTLDRLIADPLLPALLPDVLHRPDVLAPDVLAPGVLAPDALAPVPLNQPPLVWEQDALDFLLPAPDAWPLLDESSPNDVDPLTGQLLHHASLTPTLSQPIPTLIRPTLQPQSWLGRINQFGATQSYTLELSQAAYLNLALTDLAANADLHLRDSSGRSLVISNRSGLQNETLNLLLKAGRYTLQVTTPAALQPTSQPSSPSTPFRLLTAAVPLTANLWPSDIVVPEVEIGLLTTSPQTFIGQITNSNTVEVYQFQLTQTGKLAIALTDLQDDLDLRLVRDLNGNGVVDTGEAIALSSTWNDADETISLDSLSAGTYQLQVYQADGNSTYNLSLNTTPSSTTVLPTGGTSPSPLTLGGTSIATATLISPGSATLTDQVGSSSDFFAVDLTQSGVFSATLTGLDGDVDLRLIRDANSNGQVDAGEVVAWQWERGTQAETIRSFLQPGLYVLEVDRYHVSNPQAPINYGLTTQFSATPTDPLAFSFRLDFRQGSENLSSAARAAIDRAVAFWDGVITHSSLGRSQTFDLFIGASQFSSATTLAIAGPVALDETAEDRLVPVSGSVILNSSYINQYNSDPDYLEAIVRHEIAHTLGFGTLWNYTPTSGPQAGTLINPLVTSSTASYTANSYAGWAYGDLLGSQTPTAIPLSTDLGHWNEVIFDTELMTSNAESSGISTPASSLTLAALRDLGWNVNFGAAQPFSLV